MHGRRVLILAFTIAALGSVAGPLFAQRNNDNSKRQQQRPPQEQQDILALANAIDAALLAEVGITLPPPGGQAPATPPVPQPFAMGTADKSEGPITIKWQGNHFIKGQEGDTYIPLTLSLENSKLASGAAISIRVVDLEQATSFGAYAAEMLTPPKEGSKPTQPVRPTFAWDSFNIVDVPGNGQLSRALQLKPGKYAAFIAIKEKSPAPAGNQRNRNNNAPITAAAGPVGVLRHDITVPDFSGGELLTSSVIVAQTVEPLASALPADQQEANPYVFGPMRIVPSPEGKFAKSGELSVIFWIYGAKEAASGKPDVVVDYSFHQRLAEGEKYFNKTAPQPLNAETLPPQFSLAAGHQLPSTLSIPLTSFPAGDYRLEIKVTDKPSGNTMTQSVNFTVLPV